MKEPRESRLNHSVAAFRPGLNHRLAKLVFGIGCGISIAGVWLCAGSALIALQPGMKALLAGACLLLALGFGVAMVVLQRVTAEAAECEQRFRSLLAIAADWYWELDAELRFSRIINHPLSGPSAVTEARLGLRPWETPDMEIDPAALSLNRQDLEARRDFSDLPFRCRTASGRTLHFSVSGRPRFDDKGRFAGYWGVGRNVTAEALAREAQQHSESRYRELFSLSPTPLVLYRDGITLLANDSAARLFGFGSAEEMNGFELEQLYPAASRASMHERRKALLNNPIGKSLNPTEVQLHAVDGRQITVQANGVRVNAPDGPAMLALYHDVTERVAIEAALRRSQATLSHLFATSPDLITLTDMETSTYVMVNASFTRVCGYTADEVVGRSALELGIWQDVEQRHSVLSAVKAGSDVTNVETLFLTKSGQKVTMLVSAGKFSMDGRDYLVLNGRDVTETQRARLEHEAILKHASIGIALTRDRRFLQANPRFESMFGWEAGTLVGEPGMAVWGSREDYDNFGRLASPLLSQGKLVEFEQQMARRDGGLFWCRLRAQVVDPTHPTRGGTIWIAEDVTDRRQIDHALAAARDVAEAASRAKSAFLANTSHEIRTPLNGLLGLANLALQPGIEAGRRQQYLEQIQDSAQSLAGIISDILDLSKIEAGKFSLEAVPFNLHALLKTVHHAYQSLAQARSLELDLHVADDVPATVRGDPVRLRQILSNFITNGLKFTDRGRVQIGVARSTDPASPHRVRFTVSDTGAGIDEATQRRLFQPFTQADDSTTRRFGGTGLGLSICKELASLMEGCVGMHSTPGHGSRFWAEVPLPETDAPVIDPHAEAQDIERLAGMRVLMVEDNAVNMMIGVAMLEQWGIEVAQAVDGVEGVAAVERAVAARRPFDAVLMDVQMPRLSGHEAARRLRGVHSAQELPIIALTAAALVSEREEALAAGMNDFLTKPIDVHRLREALIRAVGGIAGRSG